MIADSTADDFPLAMLGRMYKEGGTHVFQRLHIITSGGT
jgi:hypothetical protein